MIVRHHPNMSLSTRTSGSLILDRGDSPRASTVSSSGLPRRWRGGLSSVSGAFSGEQAFLLLFPKNGILLMDWLSVLVKDARIEGLIGVSATAEEPEVPPIEHMRKSSTDGLRPASGSSSWFRSSLSSLPLLPVPCSIETQPPSLVSDTSIVTAAVMAASCLTIATVAASTVFVGVLGSSLGKPGLGILDFRERGVDAVAGVGSVLDDAGLGLLSGLLFRSLRWMA